jgi:hypothetical protein
MRDDGPIFIVTSTQSLISAGRLHGHGLNALALDPGRITFIEARHEMEAFWAIEETLRSGAAQITAGLIAQTFDLKKSQRLSLAARESRRPLLLLRPPKSAVASAAETRWPQLDRRTADATAVVQVSGSEAAVFMESGEARAAQIMSYGKVGDAVRIKSSQFFSCKQDQHCAVATRPSPAFLAALPRNFMDTLPSRLARFKERSVAPRRSGDVAYAELQDWVNSVPAVRRAMVNHWQYKLSDPAFRTAITAGLKDHPEWDRLINPEKYQQPPLSNKSGLPTGTR